MRLLKEINKGCDNCTMPDILLCSDCLTEFKTYLKKDIKYKNQLRDEIILYKTFKKKS